MFICNLYESGTSNMIQISYSEKKRKYLVKKLISTGLGGPFFLGEYTHRELNDLIRNNKWTIDSCSNKTIFDIGLKSVRQLPNWKKKIERENWKKLTGSKIQESKYHEAIGILAITKEGTGIGFKKIIHTSDNSGPYRSILTLRDKKVSKWLNDFYGKELTIGDLVDSGEAVIIPAKKYMLWKMLKKREITEIFEKMFG